MAYKQLKLWFDKELAQQLAQKICSVYSAFNAPSFVVEIDKKLDTLELKDRVEVMADALFHYLHEDYVFGIEQLLQILGPENTEETGMFTNFYWLMPIAKYVEKYGINHFDISMKAIAEITKRNTGEYTVRPYLEKRTTATLEVMKEWSLNTNSHVRRLACEGLRPRLPWATKLQLFIDDPKAILPILENLKDDASKYVQKSVANCLNDILKDNLTIGKELITEWLKTPTKERKWVIKHGLRNLIKQEDSWALKVVIGL